MLLYGVKNLPIKEADMYLPLKEFFEAEGYTVYAEVPCYGSTADIVAVKGSLITVIEMKVGMNLKLVEQVFNWRYKSHYVYAAVPITSNVSAFSRELLRNAGIGILFLDIHNMDGNIHCSRIGKLECARLNRRIGLNWGKEFREIRWDQHIIPEHSKNIAGVKHADIRVSRYSVMMDHVKKLLRTHKEITIDDIAKSIDTYYANPRAGLYNALKKYETSWCELFKKPGERKTYVRIKKDFITT